MVADMLPNERRTEAYSIIRTAMNVGVVLGPAVGGLALARRGELPRLVPRGGERLPRLPRPDPRLDRGDASPGGSAGEHGAQARLRRRRARPALPRLSRGHAAPAHRLRQLRRRVLRLHHDGAGGPREHLAVAPRPQRSHRRVAAVPGRAPRARRRPHGAAGARLGPHRHRRGGDRVRRAPPAARAAHRPRQPRRALLLAHRLVGGRRYGSRGDPRTLHGRLDGGVERRRVVRRRRRGRRPADALGARRLGPSAGARARRVRCSSASCPRGGHCRLWRPRPMLRYATRSGRRSRTA